MTTDAYDPEALAEALTFIFHDKALDGAKAGFALAVEAKNPAMVEIWLRVCTILSAGVWE